MRDLPWEMNMDVSHNLSAHSRECGNPELTISLRPRLRGDERKIENSAHDTPLRRSASRSS